MSAFLTKLILDDDGDGTHMTLVADLVYQSDRLKRTITVPAGFPTDFASIPRVLWPILQPHGGYDRGAIVHDRLYAVGGMDRGEADAVLLEAMSVCGVGRLTRWTIYAGVRVGGALVWKGYAAKRAAAAVGSGPAPHA